MFKRKKGLLVLTLFLTLTLALTAGAQAEVKNMIVLIGDGLGQGQIDLTRYMTEGKDAELELMKLPNVGIMMTSSTQGVPDSAAAGTAMATGHKTDNGMVSMSPTGAELDSILDYAETLNKSTGIISTNKVTDATPAAFAVSAESRDDEGAIAKAILNNDVEVVLGGGADEFTAETAGEDVVKMAEEMGYEHVTNETELANAKAPNNKLLGLFNPSYMNYKLDRDNVNSNEPSLKEMTKKAVQVLSRDEDGFFLMSEGARIDHAAHAADIHGVVAETLEFDETVEYAVKMTRLPDDASLAALLAQGRVDETLLGEVARVLVQFYREADTGGKIDAFGDPGVIGTNCRENFQQLDACRDTLIDTGLCRLIEKATDGFLEQNPSLFARRIEEKQIRDCHGDLREDHIYRYRGIQIIDCIEFNHRFRFQDTASDVAFLMMNLEFQGYRRTAADLFALYVRKSGDYSILGLIDFYKCYRAMVKVKVTRFQVDETAAGETEKTALVRQADRYLQFACEYAVRMSQPVIRVVCGMIAAGKSTVARQLSELFSIRHLRSDVIRKELFDISPDTEVAADFGEGLYAPEVTPLVYGKMLTHAQNEVKQGRSVILDATYSRRRFRQEVMQLSENTSSPVIFMECTAPPAEIKKRLKKRGNAQEVSDARLKHYEEMKERFQPLSDIPSDRHILVDTTLPSHKGWAALLLDQYNCLSGQADALAEKFCFDR